LLLYNQYQIFNKNLADIVDQVKLNLSHYGFVILKNENNSFSDFNLLANTLCHNFYRAGARLDAGLKTNDIFVTRTPSENFTLLVHSEGFYKPSFSTPDTCFFYCDTPLPENVGGRTILVDGFKFYELLPDDIRLNFENKGLIYESLWESSRWKLEFDVNSKSELINFLAQFAEKVVYEISDNDVLKLRYFGNAIVKKINGFAFANSMLAHLSKIDHPDYLVKKVYTKATNHVYFGDGSTIPNEIVNLLINLQDLICIKHQWAKGDILIIDNHRFMHGKEIAESSHDRIIYTKFGQIK
jgi:hypothetical protein